MRIPLKYTLRNFRTRRLTTGLTIAGVALVAFVFTAVLMMAHGVQRTLVATGSDANVIVLRKAANAEITSIIDREQANIIRSLPFIARGDDNRALAAGEIVVVINLSYQSGDGFGNLSVRGVERESFQLRPQVRLIEGRMFEWGSREIIVGRATSTRFAGTSVGEELRFGGDQWKIVGIFDTDGSGFDSEVWGDGDQLGQAFGRPVYSSVTLRLEGEGAYTSFAETFEKEIRLQSFEAKREKQFYAEQSELMATFISVLGIAITVIFSLGAMIGAMITMYAAVSNRTVEIGMLRALGFRRRSVMSAFLVESLTLSLAGGLIGLILASTLQFFSISMINFGSFAELAFSFSLSPEIAIGSLLFSLLMGLLGGFLPSIRAAQMDIVSALRET